MSTARERLKDAVHRLAGNAESLEEHVDPSPVYTGNRFEPPPTPGASDRMPEIVKTHIEHAKQIISEIEEIVK